jgi:hypothetical protein
MRLPMHPDEVENQFADNKGKTSFDKGLPEQPSSEENTEKGDQPPPRQVDSNNRLPLIEIETLHEDRTVTIIETRDYICPQENYPDGSMRIPVEDIVLWKTMTPEKQDDGMSTGYPLIRDDDLLPEPAAAVIQPEPGSMRGAPLFSTMTYDLEYPVLNDGKENNKSEEKGIPEDPDG